MTSGRGNRAAPPAPDGHGEVRFADAAAAEGWESLTRQARGNTYRAWIEVTGSGRIWYLVDTARATCWITSAGTGHPRATDRS
ncbi:hypothetical protein ACIRPR_17570 [Streptomyces griseoflavus]|uniref:hypothetical protein n=1 Tax=Streptomyces griseoflavus TaxID=35619 RepID=UPI003814BFAB